MDLRSRRVELTEEMGVRSGGSVATEIIRKRRMLLFERGMSVTEMTCLSWVHIRRCDASTTKTCSSGPGDNFAEKNLCPTY